jgi:rhomboid protease GluP
MYPSPPEYPPKPTPFPEDPDEPAEDTSLLVALPDTRPLVTQVLVALIVGTFVLGLLLGEDALFLWGAKVNEAILGYGEYYRLLTVMFLHANLIHLFMNTYALWIIGQDVERFYGHARFLAIFFLGGLTASVASLALTPGPAVGASGAVFAIFAAEMVLLVQNRALFGPAARQRLQNLVLLLLVNAAIGFAGSAFIDNWAHIGGFLGGSVVAWLLVPTYQVAMGPYGEPTLADRNPGRRLPLVIAGWLTLLAVAVWFLGRGA